MAALSRAASGIVLAEAEPHLADVTFAVWRDIVFGVVKNIAERFW